jgi:ribosome-associated protein
LAEPALNAAPEDLELGMLCAQEALDRKARDVRLLFVGDRLGIASYFVLATVNNRRQARAVRDAIRLSLKAAGAGVPMAASEDPDGRWSLYDYRGVIVHLFDDEGRKFFDLDSLWNDVPEVPIEERRQAAS